MRFSTGNQVCTQVTPLFSRLTVSQVPCVSKNNNQNCQNTQSWTEKNVINVNPKLAQSTRYGKGTRFCVQAVGEPSVKTQSFLNWAFNPRMTPYFLVHKMVG